MKKHLTTLLAIGLLAGSLGTLTAHANSSESPYVSPISGSGWLHDTESQLGSFHNTYYRLKSKTKATIMMYKTTGGGTVTKPITLPKGTIVAAKKDGKWLEARYNTISYGLKKKGIPTKGVAGDGELAFKIKTIQATKITRPAYAPAYGTGAYLSGGLKAIEQLATYKYNQVTVTSDGYLEYFPAAKKTFTTYNTFTDSDYTWSVMHATKPTQSIKITKANKKGATVNLFTKVKPVGIPSQRVAKSGKFQYKVALKNRHQPYTYEDNSYADDTAIASTYSIGKMPFYTVIGGGFN